MKNNKNSKGLSRLAFLKASGLAAAGYTFLPGFVTTGQGGIPEMAESGNGLAGIDLADYQIVLPAQADPIEKQAAQQLQHYLSALSATATAGISPVAVIAIVGESEFRGKKGIYVGRTDYAKAQKIDFATLSGDGYTYKPVGKHLIIAGGSKNGVLYGVDDFLEGLGYRKYSPADEYIPKKHAAGFGKNGIVFNPTITYRTTSYSQMGDQTYSDWHKISSKSDWGLFVHTFNTLVPPQEYGQTHPEYFSLIKGDRKPGTQLCLSNQAVVDVLAANLRKKIMEKPLATYWSVSQNDNDQYCRCEACTALNEKYGGVPSGSILYFVNKVAKEFPDKIISTLAYWYSRKAPKNITAEPNVNIMLCNIESRRQGPVFETDPDFSNDLKNWGALTKDILLWDYNIQFTNYFAPFPNLYTIKPNIKFYTDNNVRALFMQSNSEPAAEMALLRSYLICKLMWTPEEDDKTIIDDFLLGYYGAAGPYILQYIDIMHQSLLKSGFKLNIFGDPIDAKEAFLSTKMMAGYQQLFDQAEKAVSGDAALLKRVQTARLPILYAAIQIGRTEVDTPRSLYQHTTGGIIVGKPEMIALVNRFVEGCKQENVKLVRERAGSPDHFLAAYTRIFTNMQETVSVISFGKKIIPVTQPNPKSKAVQGFTDGIFGSYEAWQSTDYNWIYYTGEHMDFILDLGEVMPVASVNMDFLNPQAQPDWHLMALPKYVTYAISVDGEKYGEAIQVTNPHNPNPIENPDITKISIQSFTADLRQASADGHPAGKTRYIKVHAENLLKTPSWHIRAGQPMSIYSDQIVVK